MKRIAVFVATTGGLARVERITRERAPQSMVCLNRSSTVLPISADYDSFVRPGSGVIEKTFGPFEPGAFRLDVSAPIETGESWQLGFFVAHAICAAGGALAAPEEADAVIWLTGQVDCDLAVGAVGHVAEKLHASHAAFAAWAAARRRVTLFLPDGTDLAPPAGVDVVFVRTASDVLARLGLPPAPGRQMLPAHPALMRRAPVRLLAGGFALSAVAAVALSQWPAAAPVERLEAVAMPVVQAPPAADEKPAPPPVAAAVAPSAMHIEIVERRAPEGRTCAEVQFGTVPAVEAPVSGDAEMTTSALKGLCGLGVTVDNGPTARFVAVNVEAVAGKLLYGTVRPDSFTGQAAFEGRQQWAIDLPRRLPGPFEIRVTAVSGDHALSADADSDQVAATTLHHRVLP